MSRNTGRPLAAHVQAAIAGAMQPKVGGVVGAKVAAHVQAAIAGAMQPKVDGVGGPKVATNVLAVTALPVPPDGLARAGEASGKAHAPVANLGNKTSTGLGANAAAVQGRTNGTDAAVTKLSPGHVMKDARWQSPAPFVPAGRSRGGAVQRMIKAQGGSTTPPTRGSDPYIILETNEYPTTNPPLSKHHIIPAETLTQFYNHVLRRGVNPKKYAGEQSKHNRKAETHRRFRTLVGHATREAVEGKVGYAVIDAGTDAYTEGNQYDSTAFKTKYSNAVRVLNDYGNTSELGQYAVKPNENNASSIVKLRRDLGSKLETKVLRQLAVPGRHVSVPERDTTLIALVHTVMTWFPGNLFFGPNVRSDDPGNGFDAGARSITGMEEHKYQTLERTYRAMIIYLGIKHKHEVDDEIDSLNTVVDGLEEIMKVRGVIPYTANDWVLGEDNKYSIRAAAR